MTYKQSLHWWQKWSVKHVMYLSHKFNESTNFIFLEYFDHLKSMFVSQWNTLKMSFYNWSLHRWQKMEPERCDMSRPLLYLFCGILGVRAGILGKHEQLLLQKHRVIYALRHCQHLLKNSMFTSPVINCLSYSDIFVSKACIQWLWH